MALGDDILAIAKDKQEAEEAIEAFKKLENSGLAMNVSKTQIISEGEDMVGVTNLCGIEVSESMKYFRMHIFCSRQKTLQSVKRQIQKFVGYLVGNSIRMKLPWRISYFRRSTDRYWCTT